jgi:hypothetical protein
VKFYVTVKCFEACSNPEAREIVERAVKQLERLEGLIGNRVRIEAVYAEVDKLIKDTCGKYPKIVKRIWHLQPLWHVH